MKTKLKYLIGILLIGLSWMTSAQPEFPLHLDIDVSPDTDTRMIAAGRDGEAELNMITFHIKIRQSFGRLYTKPLTAELYIIGEQIQTGYYGVMDVIKKQFTLTEKDDRSFTFSTQPYMFGETGGNITVGGEYETYLIVVLDQEGKVIETRCGRILSKKEIAFIRKLGPMTLFDRDCHVVGKVKNPGAAFRAAVPAAASSGGY